MRTRLILLLAWLLSVGLAFFLGREGIQVPVEHESLQASEIGVHVVEKQAAARTSGKSVAQRLHEIEGDANPEVPADGIQLPFEEPAYDAEQADNELSLSYESQIEFQNTVYEVSTVTEFLNYGYVEDIVCADSKCDVAVSYTVSDGVSKKTEIFLTEMNDRLLENSATSAIQLGVVEISYGADGNGIARFQSMRRQPPSALVSTSIKDESDGR